MGNGLASAPVVFAGSDDLQRRYVGALTSSSEVASFCLTEPEAGSDVGAMRTTAAKHGNTYVLNGTKCFITNASHARWFTVFAKTQPGGSSCRHQLGTVAELLMQVERPRPPAPARPPLSAWSAAARRPSGRLMRPNEEGRSPCYLRRSSGRPLGRLGMEAHMKVAYVFSTSGHTASYKLGKMILPQIEEHRHGAEVVGMMFFDDNNFVLRAGDPIGERLAKVAAEQSILLMMCDQCAIERGLAEGGPGEATVKDTVDGVTVGCFPDLYAALAGSPPDQVITL